MPKRTNLFQTVVAVIHQHLADGAPIEEPAMLTNRLTGKEREVDVVLRSKAAGHEFVIGIEATSRRRGPVSAQWVESMIGKHNNLPTDKVILVSESGFTDQARDLALREYMVPISPQTLGDGDPEYRIVNSVRSLWPKQIDLSPRSARVWVDVPGDGIKWFRAPHNLDVFAKGDESYIPLFSIVNELIRGNWPRIADQLDLANVAEDFDGTAVLSVGPEWTVKLDGIEQPLYVRNVEGSKTEFHRIDGIEIVANALITVTEIQLHHRRLAEINLSYSYGEGRIGDTPALVVATESETGSMMSIKFNPAHMTKMGD
ncbi:restriction endonuclease [Nocardia sp. NPDC056952]|uniref:restriction endonuclease n=1 Tax=Nocardia sp. NPDC056952 TaxID=3345979 RepID=UPI00363FAF41